MARDEYVTPVKHTASSANSEKIAGTAGGALKGGVSAALMWIAGFTVIGAALGVFIGTGGLAGLAAGAAGSGGVINAIGSFLFSWPVLLGTAFGIGGAIVGTSTSWLPGGAGAIIGGAKGHERAKGRVADERAAAYQMEYEIAAAQGQAPAATQINVGYSPTARQGSQFNEASSKLSMSADKPEYQGTLANRQLQLA